MLENIFNKEELVNAFNSDLNNQPGKSKNDLDAYNEAGEQDAQAIENQINDLKKKVDSAKSSLNIMTIKKSKQKLDDLTNSLNKINQNNEIIGASKTETLDEINKEKPMTLEKARQKMEFKILKEYLNTLTKKQVTNFLDSQHNMNAELKYELNKALGIN